MVVLSFPSFGGAEFLWQVCGLVWSNRAPVHLGVLLVYCPVCAGLPHASWRSFRFAGDYDACRVKEGAAGT